MFKLFSSSSSSFLNSKDAWYFLGDELLWTENEQSRNWSWIIAKVKKRKRHKHEQRMVENTHNAYIKTCIIYVTEKYKKMISKVKEKKYLQKRRRVAEKAEERMKGLVVDMKKNMQHWVLDNEHMKSEKEKKELYVYMCYIS